MLRGMFGDIDGGYSDYDSTELPLINSSTTNFWRYSGSLTVPPCEENVAWTVFKDFLYVTQETLDVLQSRMLDSDGAYNGNNRVIQDLNDRTIWS